MSTARRLHEFPLLEVRQYGAPESALFPAVSDQGVPVLRSGESLVWQDKSRFRGYAAMPGAPLKVDVELPVKAHGFAWLTDQRLIVYSPDFDPGPGGGFSMTGKAINAGLRASARHRTATLVLVGQLDFSNLDFLVAREKKALLATDRYLQFGASSDAMSVALELVITKQPPDFVDDVRRLVSKAKGVEIPIHAEAPLH